MIGKIFFRNNADFEPLVSFAIVYYLLFLLDHMLEDLLKDKIEK